jgi:hypothetical protein
MQIDNTLKLLPVFVDKYTYVCIPVYRGNIEDAGPYIGGLTDTDVGG